MKHFSLFFILTFAFSIGISSCSTDPLSPADQSVIMPLKIGNRWIGRTQHYGLNGTIEKTDIDTLEIIPEDVIDGESWYVTIDNDVTKTSKQLDEVKEKNRNTPDK